MDNQTHSEKMRIVFLGGVGVVTKNMFVYEYWRDGVIKDIVVVDCGIGFTEDGQETVVPDVNYLLDKQDLIRGVALTHGHEDHTSGLFHLLEHISVPIYGTKLTVALAKEKLTEYGKKKNFFIF